MSELKALLERLDDRHRLALEWFANNAGRIQRWPEPLPNGDSLVIEPKGIYKPKWSVYALSVRQNLKGPYSDHDRKLYPDGTWTYEYAQENLVIEERDSEYTNRGLLACWQDLVPIGVLIQVKPKPKSLYEILGLAMVTGWNDGYFSLKGFSLDDQSVI